MPDLVKTGQGPAKLADGLELDKDANGFTHPNLHRRTDPTIKHSFQLLPNETKVSIQGTESYRTEITHTHDEESRYDETP